MNFNLMHPYFEYLIFFVIATSLIPWVVSFIKNLSYKITICMSVLNYLSIIGFGIINSLFIIFVFTGVSEMQN